MGEVVDVSVACSAFGSGAAATTGWGASFASGLGLGVGGEARNAGLFFAASVPLVALVGAAVFVLGGVLVYVLGAFVGVSGQGSGCLFYFSPYSFDFLGEGVFAPP